MGIQLTADKLAYGLMAALIYTGVPLTIGNPRSINMGTAFVMRQVAASMLWSKN